MSTALVLNLPEHGHMNATFSLVAELVARGERVVYLATEPWRSRVEASGAVFAAYEADAALFDPPAHRGGLYSVMAYLMGVAEQVMPDVLRQIERENDGLVPVLLEARNTDQHRDARAVLAEILLLERM